MGSMQFQRKPYLGDIFHPPTGNSLTVTRTRTYIGAFGATKVKINGEFVEPCPVPWIVKSYKMFISSISHPSHKFHLY